MSATNILILGAGYHARVIMEAIRLQNAGQIVGILDDNPDKQHSVIDGVQVCGTMADLPAWLREARVGACVLGMGNIRMRSRAEDIVNQVVSLGGVMMRVVHPTAFISPSAHVGAGCFIGPQVVVHTHAEIADHVTIYSGSTVDHDNRIESHVFIGPGVHTAGRVVIEKGAYIGPGAIIGSECRIGANSIIGAGSVVLKNIPANTVAHGTPATVRKSVAEWERST